MTITRIAQFSADNRHILDLISYADYTTWSISSTKAYTGSYSYRIANLETPLGVVIPATSQVRAGYWLNPSGLSVISDVSTRSINLFRVMYGTKFILVRIVDDATDRAVELYVDDVLQATWPLMASPLHKSGIWMHLGLTAKIGVAGFVSFYVNGEILLHWEGDADTAPIEEVYAAGRLGSTNIWSNVSYLDDFYIDDAVGELDTAPHPYRFLMAQPISPGANADFVPYGVASNYLAVDDAPADEDATLVQAASNGLRDTHNLAEITLPGGYMIQAVIPWALAKGQVGSAITLHAYDGSLYDHSAAKTLRTVYDTYAHYLSTPPAGGVWSEAILTSMQFGYESVL